jgi:signal transduction histidine kinase
MAKSQHTSDQPLSLLADYLSQQQNDILKDWKNAVDKDEEQSSRLLAISRDNFYDHIPDFLGRMYNRLRNPQESVKEMAAKHGKQRWYQGIDIGETTREWTKLHHVLIDYVDSSRGELSLHTTVRDKGRKIITGLIYEGITVSIEEYNYLQRRETEAQIRDLESTLRRQVKEQLDDDQRIQQTSHDLHGALLSLQIGFSLLEDKPHADETAKTLKEMSLAVDNLERLLNKLLDLFRLRAGREEVELTNFNVADTLKELCDSLQPLAREKNLELLCSGESPFSVQGDRDKIQRIVQNLVINALKYTVEGSVTITWEKISGEEWMLTVCDTGPGLSSANGASQSSVVDTGQAANSGKNSGWPHGEGIGLLIVRQLSKLLDAVIDVETTPGEGTEFNIVFPLSYS